MPTFEDLNIPPGFLTDRQIRCSLEGGYLIQRGSWCAELIRHASYTLRIGDHIEIADSSAANVENERRFKRVDLKEGDHVDLRPGDTAKLFSIEVLHLPASVMALTVARGLIFFEALVPENTYVDPGFSGTLYTTVTNLSNRVIRLDYGDPVTRLFFFRLTEDVGEPYVKGSAKGLKQRLESRRATTLGTDEECRKATRSELINELRKLPVGGAQIASLARRDLTLVAWSWGIALIWPPLLFVANTNPWVLHTVLGRVLANVGSLVMSIVLPKAAMMVWERFKRL